MINKLLNSIEEARFPKPETYQYFGETLDSIYKLESQIQELRSKHVTSRDPNCPVENRLAEDMNKIIDEQCACIKEVIEERKMEYVRMRNTCDSLGIDLSNS